MDGLYLEKSKALMRNFNAFIELYLNDISCVPNLLTNVAIVSLKKIFKVFLLGYHLYQVDKNM